MTCTPEGQAAGLSVLGKGEERVREKEARRERTRRLYIVVKLCEQPTEEWRENVTKSIGQAFREQTEELEDGELLPLYSFI